MKTIFKKFSAVTFALLASTAAVQAQDWTGGYAGIQYGTLDGTANFDGAAYLWDSDTPTGDALADAVSLTGDAYGGRLGYDMDLGGGLVLGIIGDFSQSSAAGAICIEAAGEGCDGYVIGSDHGTSELQMSINSIATVRGRIGMASGNALFYASAGFASANVTGTVTNIAYNGDDDQTATVSMTGYAAGIGAEFLVTDNISVGVEFVSSVFNAAEFYMESGTENVDVIGDADLTTNSIGAFINYRF